MTSHGKLFLITYKFNSISINFAYKCTKHTKRNAKIISYYALIVDGFNKYVSYYFFNIRFKAEYIKNTIVLCLCVCPELIGRPYAIES